MVKTAFATSIKPEQPCWNQILKVFANTLDPDETPQIVASHQDPNSHLADHNLDGLQQFVATFVRVKTSTSGTPHRTVLSTLSQGNNSAFGF
ncbi:hypothetical protein DPMN_133463 [Dreissena polymorpha]|uniref:Uncharacterized protein n=1 Tax=Dreissena polymorpha TaxID=45954 RepID=A0A9D4FV92_DREPO|nr:hypothetical protein DPMN_133463 [Dreissena polymorpha]